MGATLGAVDLAVIRVLTGLFVTGTKLNIAAMMGLTMVIGIAAELGVLHFVDLPKRVVGHEDRVNAGLARLYQLLMSRLIAIPALAPLALKIGQWSAVHAPMAVAIISGLNAGTPLVLIAQPIPHTVTSQIAPPNESSRP